TTPTRPPSSSPPWKPNPNAGGRPARWRPWKPPGSTRGSRSEEGRAPASPRAPPSYSSVYRRRSGTASSLLRTYSIPGHALKVTGLIVERQAEQTTSASRPCGLTWPCHRYHAWPHSAHLPVFHRNCFLRHDVKALCHQGVQLLPVVGQVIQQ